MNDSKTYLLRWRGQVSGPFPLETVLHMLDEHEIGIWHEVQHDGAWLSLEEFLALKERERVALQARLEADKQERPTAPRDQPAVAPPPPADSPAPVARAAFAQPRFRPKSMKLFSVLGFTLGFAGAHNFYASYWGTAIAQLLLSALTCWLGFGIFGAWLWALIELLLVHTDGRGVRMA